MNLCYFITTLHRWCGSIFLPLTLAISMVIADPIDTMFMRGDSALSIQWIPDSINTRVSWYLQNGSKCTGSDTVYRHCDFLAGVTYTSIAYSYGGEDRYDRFREKIDNGFVVGSHLCHYTTFGDPTSAVAGTDCSGFVCDLWGVPRVSTRELHSQYTVIDRDELDAGDILVKPASHVVLIVEREDNDHFLIWESTSAVNGCRERSIDITDSYWDAYYPRRYKGLTSSIKGVALTVPTDGFPHVAMANGCITLFCHESWHGTIELYTLLGRKMIAITYDSNQNPGPTLTPPLGIGNGIAIALLRSDNGALHTVSLVTHR